MDTHGPSGKADDRVEARPVQHTGIELGLLIDPTTDRGDDPLDDLEEVLVVLKLNVGANDLPFRSASSWDH